ncbi:MAG TPA: TatD family hydrolase [Candidatus Omnitrophota bacterium]|nr:TatD family hydrolase [Candidatus Omnitrophota bacterium]
MTHLVDTHAHLDSVQDIEGALQRASEAGVIGILAVGEDQDSNRKNLSLQRPGSGPEIRVGLGIHPGRIVTERLDEEFAFIAQYISKASAVGEIGLDFWYKWVRKDDQKKEEQRSVYRRLLALAIDHGLPAVIHTRGAWREAFEIAKEMKVARAVFHWYSGPLDVLEDILKEGYFISASPSVAYSPESRQSLVAAPVEQTLIETDSPVYYKQCEGGFQAEPKDVFRTLKYYATLKQRGEDDLARILNGNAIRLFGFSDAG